MTGPWIRLTTRAARSAPEDVFVNMANVSLITADAQGARVHFLGSSAHPDFGPALDVIEVSESPEKIMRRIKRAERSWAKPIQVEGARERQ